MAPVAVPETVIVYVPAGVAPESVVTDAAELWAERPAESEAATVKLYVVAGAKPVTLKVVVVAVPIETPFW